jgi:hypothetical protein
MEKKVCTPFFFSSRLFIEFNLLRRFVWTKIVPRSILSSPTRTWELCRLCGTGFDFDCVAEYESHFLTTLLSLTEFVGQKSQKTNCVLLLDVHEMKSSMSCLFTWNAIEFTFDQDKFNLLFWRYRSLHNAKRSEWNWQTVIHRRSKVS